jgi:hypothetical protein
MPISTHFALAAGNPYAPEEFERAVALTLALATTKGNIRTFDGSSWQEISVREVKLKSLADEWLGISWGEPTVELLRFNFTGRCITYTQQFTPRSDDDPIPISTAKQLPRFYWFKRVRRL